MNLCPLNSYWRKARQQKSAARLFCTTAMALLIAGQTTPPALAFRSSIAAVAGAKRLQQGMPDGRDDISFSPILLELAKLIGRTGLPAGFFLQNDSPSFPEDTGLDLRSLLLYQAGLIKMPVRMPTTRKPPTKGDGPPQIAVPSIPESRKEINGQPAENADFSLPSLAAKPLPRAPISDQVVPPKASVGSPEHISISTSGNQSGQPAPTPILAFDIAGLHTDLTAEPSTTGPNEQLNLDVPKLAMAMPRTNSMPFITNNAFRLWTFHPDAIELAEQGNTSHRNMSSTTFGGTFIVASIGSIKGITGRHITLGQGRVLASNHGGELLFRTGLAEISMPADTIAVIEVNQKGQPQALLRTIKIYALASQDSGSITAVLPSGKETTFKLEAGQVLTIGDHRLTDSELSGVGSNNHNNKREQENIARGTFSVSQFVDRELMLKSDHAVKSSERYVTLSNLKHKLSTSP